MMFMVEVQFGVEKKSEHGGRCKACLNSGKVMMAEGKESLATIFLETGNIRRVLIDDVDHFSFRSGCVLCSRISKCSTFQLMTRRFAGFPVQMMRSAGVEAPVSRDPSTE